MKDPPGVSTATTGTPSDYADSVLQRLCAVFHSVAHNIETAGAQQKHYYDPLMKHKFYGPGDLVWIDLPALGWSFQTVNEQNPVLLDFFFLSHTPMSITLVTQSSALSNKSGKL